MFSIKVTYLPKKSEWLNSEKTESQVRPIYPPWRLNPGVWLLCEQYLQSLCSVPRIDWDKNSGEQRRFGGCQKAFSSYWQSTEISLFFSCRETSWLPTSILSSLEPSLFGWPMTALARSLWLLPKCWPVGGERSSVSHFPDVPWNCVPCFSSFFPSHFV